MIKAIIEFNGRTIVVDSGSFDDIEPTMADHIAATLATLATALSDLARDDQA
jgi:hypothetical protein